MHYLPKEAKKVQRQKLQDNKCKLNIYTTLQRNLRAKQVCFLSLSGLGGSLTVRLETFCCHEFVENVKGKAQL